MITHFKVLLIASGIIAATACRAESLGRLFFSPEQRVQLEYSNLEGSDSGNSARTLTVNGIVQKHGGKRTAWINGVPQQAGNSDEHSPGSLPIKVPGSSKSVKVKVGQKVLINQPADTE